jgi:hypothetical protein
MDALITERAIPRVAAVRGTPAIAVWVGAEAPARSVRWLDGALAAAGQLGPATAIAAGAASWLDLAADRATRAGLACVGVPSDLRLDYLGRAQIVAAVVRQLGATTVLVDEASQPERYAEVGAIAELVESAQLTHVVAVTRVDRELRASRVAGRELQRVRVRGPVVLGVRIAGPAVDEYPTPLPSAAMRRLELPALGLDPQILGHRAMPLRSSSQVRKTVERVAEFLAVHLVPQGDRREDLG